MYIYIYMYLCVCQCVGICMGRYWKNIQHTAKFHKTERSEKQAAVSKPLKQRRRCVYILSCTSSIMLRWPSKSDGFGQRHKFQISDRDRYAMICLFSTKRTPLVISRENLLRGHFTSPYKTSPQLHGKVFSDLVLCAASIPGRHAIQIPLSQANTIQWVYLGYHNT